MMQKYAASNDFTGESLNINKSKFTEEQGQLYKKARRLFADEWKARLSDFGVKDSMRNFSANYPLNTLRDANGDRLAVSATAIHSDPESFSDILDIFFEMTEKPLEAGLNALAKSLGKRPEDLTDEEIGKVVEAVADLFFKEMINALMHAQNVEGIFQTAHRNGAIEDFSDTVDNHDMIDFIRQWTHNRTMVGETVSLERLEAENPEAFEKAMACYDPDPFADHRTDEELFDSFMRTLNEDEQDLFCALSENRTQTDIAQSLEITQGAVSKRVAKLKEKYKEYIKS